MHPSYRVKHFKKVRSKCGTFNKYKLTIMNERNKDEFDVTANEKILQKFINQLLSEDNNV